MNIMSFFWISTYQICIIYQSGKIEFRQYRFVRSDQRQRLLQTSNSES